MKFTLSPSKRIGHNYFTGFEPEDNLNFFLVKLEYKLISKREI